MARIRPLPTKSGTSYEVDTGRKFGPRRRPRFKTRIEAREYVESLNKEVRLYGRNVLLLDPFERASLMKILGEMKEAKVTLEEVWLHFRNERVGGSPELLQAMREFMMAQKAKNLRERYLGELEIYLTRFISGRERDKVHTVTKKDLEEWMAQHNNPHTFIGRWGLLSAFFSYCVKKEYIDKNPMLLIEKPRADRTAPKILSADEVQRLLLAAHEIDKEFLPYLLIGVFCGLRPDEIKRLSVDDFRWATTPGESKIVVRSEVSKTRQRRIVSIPETLEGWKPFIDDWAVSGRLVNFRRRLVAVRDQAKVKWSNDVMRHTAASIMVANYESAEKAALELGHSTQTLMTHYREIMTKDAAERYLALRP